MGRPPRRQPRIEVWMKVIDGGAIKRRRMRKQFSQRELAAISGCSQATIHYLETGKMTTLTYRLALKISQRLDCDLEDLFIEKTSPLVPAVTTVQPVAGPPAEVSA